MALHSLLSSLFLWLPRFAAPSPASAPAPSLPVPIPSRSAFRPEPMVAWGARVTGDFKRKTIAIARRLGMDPNHLMAIMAFETGRTFDPAITNRAGSGATGLIQFMPATAKALGTTTARLAVMSAVDQLDYVETYLAPYKGKMGDLASAYMAVLYPRAVGKEPGYVLFRKGSVAYRLNRGLDTNGDGAVTKTEAAAKVEALLIEGLRLKG
ncbi:MAG: transglycosylase SLT domain-containing protein [Hoeflea sp.]|uniref:transglycosylase SLT domain-containing protein n=1 Tax=Hoeflea sp. TaxID=1940281 RepID=UPI00272FDC01|nr:transglycosylase SLT domain-containing protein [Hoeflea sp.]MDP2121358.1 transglycosylase SLT domain-containing protein [Hoeflea sp.]